MPTPAEKLNAELKKLFKRLLKLPALARIGIALALTAGVYALLTVAIPNFCLNNLVSPLVLVGLLWKLEFKGVKKLILIGALASVVIAGVWAAVAADYYMNLPLQAGESEDGELTGGTVTPVYGDSQTVHNFTVTVNLPNSTSVVKNVTVLIGNLELLGGVGHNYTMNMSENTTTSRTYYYETSVPHPLNLFVFWAEIDGKAFVAGNQDTSSKSPLPTFGIEGPVYDDYGALALVMLPYGLYAGFVSIFPVYAILVLMVWWLKKARQMRIEAYQKAVTEREREREGVTKDEAKVPSLAKAMGVESEDKFVCSECGADVPSDAKVCPKCGEKFD